MGGVGSGAACAGTGRGGDIVVGAVAGPTDEPPMRDRPEGIVIEAINTTTARATPESASNHNQRLPIGVTASPTGRCTALGGRGA